MESKGHICFAKRYTDTEMLETVEFFDRDGVVFRAPFSDVIMPDGYRTGRRECSRELFEKYRGILLGGFDYIQ